MRPADQPASTATSRRSASPRRSAAAGLSGAPVAGERGGAAEAVEHGTSGLVVTDPDDAAAVADSLTALLDDPDRRRRMGASARRRATARFSYDRLAGDLCRALR